MKHKKLPLNSKIATLTKKNMPSYISRVIAIILLEMSTLKNYRLTKVFKNHDCDAFRFLQSLSIGSTAFFYAQFF